jgi:hypothetical protein
MGAVGIWAQCVQPMVETSACSLDVFEHEQDRASSTLGRCGSGDIDGLDGNFDDCFDFPFDSADKPTSMAHHR